MRLQTLMSLKLELKSFAQSIRENRSSFRAKQSHHDKEWSRQTPEWANQLKKEIYTHHNELVKARYEFRHKHIVYCLLRGRTMAQIESSKKQKCEKDCYCCNKPSQKYLDSLFTKFSTKLKGEQDAAANVCVGA